jgi:hypothetical protein
MQNCVNCVWFFDTIHIVFSNNCGPYFSATFFSNSIPYDLNAFWITLVILFLSTSSHNHFSRFCIFYPHHILVDFINIL